MRRTSGGEFTAGVGEGVPLTSAYGSSVGVSKTNSGVVTAGGGSLTVVSDANADAHGLADEAIASFFAQQS